MGLSGPSCSGWKLPEKHRQIDQLGVSLSEVLSPDRKPPCRPAEAWAEAWAEASPVGGVTFFLQADPAALAVCSGEKETNAKEAEKTG